MSTSNLKDEELLNLLKNNVTISTQQVHKNEILLFLTNYKIETGTEQVTNNIIYELYTNWCKTPLTYIQFIHYLSKYIKVNKKYSFINMNSLLLTKNLLLTLKDKPDHTRSNTKILKNHLEIFFNNYSIKKGQQKVYGLDLWKLYQNWLRDTYRKKGFNKEEFFNLLNIYLKAFVTKNGIFYKVSDNINNILIKESIISAKEKTK